jgi:hypothetical protein
VVGPVQAFRADPDDEKLILLVVEKFSGLPDHVGAFHRAEFAKEDAVLHVLAVVFEQVEETGAAFVIRDIVGA